MTIESINLINNMSNIDFGIIFKWILLLLIALYAVFALMVFNQIRSLDKLVFLPSRVPEFLVKEFALFYFLAVVSLFLLAFVIL